MKTLPANYRRLLSPALAELSAYEPETAQARILLDANESPFAPGPAFQKKLALLARRLELNRYPDPSAKALKSLVRSHYGAGPGAGVVLGNGSDEIIAMLCTALQGKGRPRLAIPTPTFSMFAHIGRSLGFEVVAVPLNDFFDLDPGDWKRALGKKRVNLVFLASPNNPTGGAYNPEVISWMIANSGAFVVVDEAYGDYGGPTFVPGVGEAPNLVVLKTLSKIGFAGLRLGMALSAQSLTGEIEKIRLPYNVSSFSQEAARLFFGSPQEMRRHAGEVVEQREWLLHKLLSLPRIEAFPSDANFILFRAPRGRAGHVHRGLLRRGIRIRNLSRPGPLRDCLRVTIGTPAENRAFWAALSPLVE